MGPQSGLDLVDKCDAGQTVEVAIACQQHCPLRPRCCENDGIGAGEFVDPASIGGREGDFRIERDDLAYLREGNHLIGFVFTYLAGQPFLPVPIAPWSAQSNQRDRANAPTACRQLAIRPAIRSMPKYRQGSSEPVRAVTVLGGRGATREAPERITFRDRDQQHAGALGNKGERQPGLPMLSAADGLGNRDLEF